MIPTETSLVYTVPEIVRLNESASAESRFERENEYQEGSYQIGDVIARSRIAGGT